MRAMRVGHRARVATGRRSAAQMPQARGWLTRLMPKIIDRRQVRALIARGAQLVEVLPAEDFAEEHLAGAINIPLKELDERSAARLDRARPVIVYCHDLQ
ncbi:MAG: hypothetical protein E6J38_10050 [Chloroflexi bacterium]|nr:MAG: hypothetical protein E6J49_06255 [Chloroflexota bacterium]TMB93716.1 MAG: hypothetical protein E6J38_10050 [Chloroflexota bacterium]TMC28659.1 MAG: hypothetical protein E6J27_07770 [Chloroflexota bacterium]TMC32176.1 MAG: hypothetical protein E6J24_14420 [Chloroflexota bacterium]TMC57284.1 MAG: hypothetical protein E6J19_06425 [Chloroflexota bacterium]